MNNLDEEFQKALGGKYEEIASNSKLMEYFPAEKV
jgi:hypothetical protein